ncbi:IucA/IucC family C-terminal-domain containing protein [Bacillus sp. UNCCL13]|uniref:IucA/IucC family C-terminal-domain containing protein n=1 Tax=Bacillus sp. UNCCL13 TaxID=1502772 RepID=UPI0015878BFD|nr:IucA/IucC family C-terminal-domain containing protein [Bacillus sp. UNCCL13]
MSELSKQEQEELSEFRLSFIGDKKEAIHTVQFLDPLFLKTYLQELSLKIGSPSLKVTASIFMKRYAFLAVIGLFAMSRWDKRIDLSMKNVWLENASNSFIWLPAFSLDNPVAVELDSTTERDEWRKSVIDELFSQHISLLIEQLNKVTKISKLILWENIAVYVFWLYETVLSGAGDEERQQMIENDFKFIFTGAGGQLYGQYNHNPLARFNHPKKHFVETNEEIRIRKTCCFSYKLGSSMKRCKTCPCQPIDGSCAAGQGICEVDKNE